VSKKFDITSEEVGIMAGRLNFPEVTDVQITFGGYPEDWFKMVRSLPEDEEYSKKVQHLFFHGGEIGCLKDLPEEYYKKGVRMLRCVLGSFNPKHEHKIHVCGLILKSLTAETCN
jgi:hypothetical protein